MRFTFVALLFLATVEISQGEVPQLLMPQLFHQRAFDAIDLAEAVNHYVALGEGDGVRELTALAVENDSPQSALGKDPHLPERIGWVCRILFIPKDGRPLPPPGLGSLRLPFKTMPLANWPLYPVAASGKSYFVLGEGYMLAGLPEPAEWYIASCHRAGVFRTQPVPIPTGAEARRDAEALRNSAAWKIIKWKDRGEGFSYVLSEQQTWKFIQSQADAIK